MIYSLVARISERISFIKDLVNRLKNDMIFRLDCGFLVSDSVPSEAKIKGKREQWLVEEAEREASLPLFEKKIEDQLDVP